MPNNKPILFLLHFTFIMILNFPILLGKSKVNFELGSSINYNIYNSNFNGFPGYDCCGHFTNGNGLGANFSLTGFYKNFFSTSFLDLSYFTSLSARNLSGKFEYDEYFADAIIGYDVYKAISRHTLQTNIHTLTFTPGLEFGNFLRINQLSLRIGIPISIPLTAYFNQKESLVSPENAYYENYQKERNVFKGKINRFRNPLFGLNFQIGWKILLNNNFYIYPSLTSDFPLTNLVKDIEWKSYQLGLGLAFGFSLPHPKPKPPMTPPFLNYPEPFKPKTVEPIQIDIIVHENEKRIKNHDTISIQKNIKKYIELKPFPAIIYYKRNDFLFGADTIETTDEFSNYFATNLQILTSTFSYLQNNPEEKITIVCSQIDDEQANICDLRIARLVEYFRIQGLEERITEIKKIKFVAKKQIPELIEEQRRIQIFFNNGTNIVNIENEIKYDTSYFTPNLQIQINVKPEQIVKQNTEIYFNNKINKTTEKLFSFNFENISNFGSKFFDTLLIKTKIETIEEIHEITEESLKIYIKDKESISNEFYYFNPFKVGNYILVALFEFDKSDPYWINPKTKDLVENLNQKGKKIEIVGSVDNIGTENHNQKLALNRAKSINKILGLNYPIQILEQHLRNRNQNPIERTLNRSAWIRFD